MRRAFGVATLVAMMSVGLTACDPPLPPDVAAQIAEQTYTCVDGSSTVAFTEGMVDIQQGLIDSVSAACADPAMGISASDSVEGANIVLSDYLTSCKPEVSVPYATEAAEVTAYFADGYAIVLSPKTLARIFNGEIRSWSDEAIAQDNPDQVLPDKPIVVRKTVDENAFNALQNWFTHLGAPIADSFTKITGIQTFEPLVEGEIAIIPHSVGYVNATVPVGILLGIDKDGFPVVANADNMGISTAATKWTAKQDLDKVTVQMNFDAEPLVLSGFDSAATPYDAIYPVNLQICPTVNLTHRANAMFLLRLDSQGALGASAYNPLSEGVRVVSLLAVRKGLPTPSVPPAQ